MAVYHPPQDESGVRKHKISFDLSKAPSGISRIAVTLTEDQGAGFVKVQNLKASVQVADDVIELTPAQFSTEKGIVVLELYLRNSQPKVKSVWQGFTSGLDGLCRHFGVEVADDGGQATQKSEVQGQQTSTVVTEKYKQPDHTQNVQSSPPPAVPQPSPADAQKTPEPPSGDSKKVNLQKVTGKVNLSKGQAPVIIDKTPEITAYVTWASETDYDIYALVLTSDGRQVDVARFGAEGVPPLQSFDNGAVEHMGDVTRSEHSGTGSTSTKTKGFFSFGSSKKSKAESKTSETKTEIIKIRPKSSIFAVVPVVYSAQSNGTGSFYLYRVSMTIDNNQGTTVMISSENANNDDDIFTCVPGMILNTPEGIVIDPVEKYSKPGSENRPMLKMGADGSIKILMDAGPENDFK